jgi:predicted Zn-dependent protease
LRSALQVRRFGPALEHCQRLLQKNPGNANLLALAAQAALGLGRYEEAEAFLVRALEARPDSAALQQALERVRRKM